ncbi:hypothetical protein CONPUDRAFT_148402 [Coniophora puteana RWD-64-598 SS2]|uniref:CxC1-like cysteine cluster associated with KDZ transposases domain-containing protein n=1 Tax=Coniophora puteana (strain RWD-64-598) TaxID=741705 RepID=A0A5M3N4F7_CONPW|nr:uncharacterized protein CONPUDRAFT_148402 [Coniophora puteana RWD-64-598 SS2]EIW86310.1 hypothetical protein CONPUDRAFT_148402 [Coniophora puteana RWD-64-598 SS2]
MSDADVEMLVESAKKLSLVDIFAVRTSTVSSPFNLLLVPVLVRQGFIFCLPNSPSTVFTVQSLRAYHVLKMRTPQVSTQSYVRSLCDLHRVVFNTHLARQFVQVFNMYIQIKHKVAGFVREALRCDMPDWHLAHVCPCCMYHLTDEPELKYSMFYTMDGNDSLKCAYKCLQDISEGAGASSKLPSLLKVPPDRYLNCETVNKWANNWLDALISDEGMEDNPCAGRWKNMKDNIAKKMWAVFNETGIFLAVCRHGFLLLVADMVRSREL